MKVSTWAIGVTVVLHGALAASVSRLPASAPAAPHADVPTRGSADLCFRFAGPVGDIVALLEGAGVDVVDGPVPRPASNGVLGTSVYFRDPDGNLLELLTTHDAPQPTTPD